MAVSLHYFALSAPLFGMVLLGYVVARNHRWKRTWSAWCSRVVFAVLLPALLFTLLSKVATLPPTDPRLLVAYFGSCLCVFALGRVLARGVFALDGVGQAIFAMGGIFSNNVLLGIPIVQSAFGAAALPTVALVTVFNSLTLWTLVSVSVEWSRHGSFSAKGLAQTALGVLTNPIIAAIMCGTLFGYSGLQLPAWLALGLSWLARSAGPSALLVLGMGLAQYGIRKDFAQSLVISALKLIVQPLIVWSIGAALGLPALELKAVVLLSAMSVGANVYLMALQFESTQAAVAGSLVISTLLAAFSIPVLLALLAAWV
ncbi:MAG: hypothetical protein RL701_6910 [Pseudomonadota bacterium]|jgi:predicted permease